MRYKHCSSIEEVEAQVGELDIKTKKYISKNFKENDNRWFFFVISTILYNMRDQIPLGLHNSYDYSDISSAISRVAGIIANLDEVNTLHILRCYNSVRNNDYNIYLLNSIREINHQLNTDVLSNNLSVLERIYLAEQEVSKNISQFLNNFDKTALSLESILVLSKILSKEMHRMKMMKEERNVK